MNTCPESTNTIRNRRWYCSKFATKKQQKDINVAILMLLLLSLNNINNFAYLLARSMNYCAEIVFLPNKHDLLSRAGTKCEVWSHWQIGFRTEPVQLVAPGPHIASTFASASEHITGKIITRICTKSSIFDVWQGSEYTSNITIFKHWKVMWKQFVPAFSLDRNTVNEFS